MSLPPSEESAPAKSASPWGWLVMGVAALLLLSPTIASVASPFTVPALVMLVFQRQSRAGVRVGALALGGMTVGVVTALVAHTASPDNTRVLVLVPLVAACTFVAVLQAAAKSSQRRLPGGSE